MKKIPPFYIHILNDMNGQTKIFCLTRIRFLEVVIRKKYWFESNSQSDKIMLTNEKSLVVTRP